MMNMIYSDEVYAIQGAIYEVYKNIGTGFLENVYQECMEFERGRAAIKRIRFELLLRGFF